MFEKIALLYPQLTVYPQLKIIVHTIVDNYIFSRETIIESLLARFDLRFVHPQDRLALAEPTQVVFVKKRDLKVF